MILDKNKLNHPIVEQSFAIIDREIGEHNFNPTQYAIVRRVIHATADFEYTKLLQFSPDAIESGVAAIKRGVPIITDVTMVKQGIVTLVEKTFNNPVIAAVEQVEVAIPGKTRTETGLLRCWEQYPEAIYVIGNAPTALLALCQQLSNKLSNKLSNSKTNPSLVIGVPVGFVAVIESKQTLAKLKVPQILTQGSKGGSSVAASILNALLIISVSEG